jgi:hypothetical protein
VFIDPTVSLTVTGPTGAASVRSLQVGGGNGIATLSLNGGVLSVAESVTVAPTGVLTGDGVIEGTVTNRGTVLANNLTITDGLTNHGIVTGSGRINASLNNQPVGEISVQAGQQLRISGGTGPSVNHGQIDVIGGTLRFDHLFQNASGGLLVARDATLRFMGAAANGGTIGLSFGTTDIFGAIFNNPGAQIIVSGNSNVTFYNSVIHAVLAEIRVSAGSTAVFVGPVTGSGFFTGGGTKFFEMGVSSLATIETTGSTIVEAPATLTVDVIRESSLTTAGQVYLRSGGGASRVGSLAIAGGRVDIGNNQMLIETGNVAQTRAWLLTGRPGGSGIGSALAAGQAGRDVGYSPTAEGMLVRFTWAGDASLDGSVTIADLGILAANWQQSNRHWFQGDFNYDGSVNIADLGILAGNWQAGVSGGSSMSFAEALALFDVFDGVVVPEPAGLSLLGIAGLLAIRRRGGRRVCAVG